MNEPSEEKKGEGGGEGSGLLVCVQNKKDGVHHNDKGYWLHTMVRALTLNCIASTTYISMK